MAKQKPSGKVVGSIRPAAGGARVTRTGAGLTFSFTGHDLVAAGAPTYQDVLQQLVAAAAREQRARQAADQPRVLWTLTKRGHRVEASVHPAADQGHELRVSVDDDARFWHRRYAATAVSLLDEEAEAKRQAFLARGWTPA